MKLLYLTIAALVLAALTLLACTEKPEYPSSDAAIIDAASDVGDTPSDTEGSDTGDSDDAEDTDATDATDTVDTGPCQGACSGETPHCDDEAGVCVACLDDTHCEDGVCSEDNTCVACLEDGDCTEGVCDTDQNICVECAGDEDCAEGVCDTDQNTCVECLSNDECTEGVCDTDQSVCVECLQTSDCAEGVCDTDQNTCVECLSNDECLDPTASACDMATNTCVACADSNDCTHLSNQRVCDTSSTDAVCVECTVGDESACGGNSCDPATNTCTNTPIGQTDTCMPCKADSECIADHRCVPMNFQGMQLQDGFCLLEEPTSDTCPKPYAALINRASISGVPAANYCGVDESVTTCAAVLDEVDDKACSGDTQCGMSQFTDDGRCVLLFGECTHPCSHHGQCEDTCASSGFCSLN